MVTARIRERVGLLLAQFAHEDRLARLRQARGLWRDRDDVPMPETLRAGWERPFLESTHGMISSR